MIITPSNKNTNLMFYIGFYVYVKAKKKKKSDYSQQNVSEFFIYHIILLHVNTATDCY